MGIKVQSNLQWFTYRAWVWEGTTVVKNDGSILAVDEMSARDCLTTDVFAEDNLAELYVQRAGTFADYEQYQIEQDAVFDEMGVK